MFLDADVNTVFDVSTGSETIAGTNAIGGDGGFTKIGSGKLIIGVPDSYTGTTIAAAGTLEVDGSIVSAILYSRARDAARRRHHRQHHRPGTRQPHPGRRCTPAMWCSTPVRSGGRRLSSLGINL
jgi:autotransporter-associated beta strand protein